MDIAITGSHGLIGSALAASLERDGHRVLRVTRDGSGGTRWDPAAGVIDAAAFEGLDGVVHLAGEGIAEKRWTVAHKARVLDSRVNGTRLIASTIAGLTRPPRVLITASGTSAGAKDPDEIVTEQTPLGSNFLSEVIHQWEAAAEPARLAGVRVAHARTGLVLSSKGGLLPRLLLPFKLGLGGRMGHGRQWMSWISLTDQVAALRFVLDHDGIAGPVNFVSPKPVTNVEFTKALGAVVKRPTIVPTPMFMLRLALGRELVDTLMLSSIRAEPTVLCNAGYVFRHPDLRDALTAATKGE